MAGWPLRLPVGNFLGADATVVVGIDNTIEWRWGRKTGPRGIDRDPVRSSKGHYVKTGGLRCPSAQSLVQVTWAGRVMALPFLSVLRGSSRPPGRHGRVEIGVEKRLYGAIQEIRAHFGAETQRRWPDLAIMRTTPAPLGLFSLTL